MSLGRPYSPRPRGAAGGPTKLNDSSLIYNVPSNAYGYRGMATKKASTPNSNTNNSSAK